MRVRILFMLLTVFAGVYVVATTFTFGQERTAVPRVIQFNGMVGTSGRAAANSAALVSAQPLLRSMTFALYREQEGGSPLWQETQNVAVDGQGRFNVSLGAGTNDGLPLDLFVSGEPRWLGFTLNDPSARDFTAAEEPRVFLASIPYALKSSDADTLGGHPITDFRLVPGASSENAAGSDAGAVDSLAGAGTVGKIPKWVTADTIGDSIMTESSGRIGIGTASPESTLDVNGAGLFSSYIGMRVSNLPVRPYPGDLLWSWTGGMVFDTGGTGRGIAFNTNDNTKMWIDDATGRVTIGNGVATGGSKLSVRGNTAVGSSYVNTGAPENGLIVEGNVGIGTPQPASKLDVAGWINASGTIRANRFDLPSTTDQYTGLLSVFQSPFLHNFHGTFLGLSSGNFTATGSGNTGVGTNTLNSNTTGTYNTAIGLDALVNNTTGWSNTAIGTDSLRSNLSGSSNIAIGAGALGENTSGSSNTAIGIGALLKNKDKNDNTAVGSSALLANTGFLNTALGKDALQANTTGYLNTAVGVGAGITLGPTNYANTIGSSNTFIGAYAGPGTSDELLNATAIGAGAVVSASSSLVLGAVGVNVGIGTSAPTAQLEINGAMRLNNSRYEKPACDATTRGTFWFTQGGAGVKDAAEVCAKDAGDAYAWRALY